MVKRFSLRLNSFSVLLFEEEMKAGRIILVSSALAIGALVSAEPFQDLTSLDGTVIRAQILAVSDYGVTIQVENGRLFEDVPFSRFSKETMRLIEDWKENERLSVDQAEINSGSKLKIKVQRGRDDEMNRYGDIDDRVVEVQSTVIIENDDIEKTYTDVDGTFVLIAQGVAIDEGKYAVILRQDFKVSISPKDEARWTSKKVNFIYDPDYGGIEYEGYLVVLRDRSGRIVLARSSRSPWEKDPGPLLEAKVKQGYDRDFTQKTRFAVKYGRR
ncbi:MAG: hypothetical protein AAGJ81_03285 [Verrucomicrobiota bacterium]